MSQIKEKLILIVLFCCFINTLNAQALSKVPDGFLVACGDDNVIVLNPGLGSDSSAIVWQWSVKEARDQLPEVYQKLLVPLDDCKPVENNTKLLLTSSGGATCILDIATKKISFYAKTPMAHSADLLPGGFVAVANSTNPKGNSLELYKISVPGKALVRDTLYSGHGVVWNAQKKRLYVIGNDELRIYKFIHRGGKVNLKRKKIFTIPDKAAHDLSLIDPNRLLVTTPENVYIFHIKTHAFTPFKPLENVKKVKSVNFNPYTDRLVYTKAEESWWTHHIYCRNPDKVIHIPFINLYKVRVAKKQIKN